MAVIQPPCCVLIDGNGWQFQIARLELSTNQNYREYDGGYYLDGRECRLNLWLKRGSFVPDTNRCFLDIDGDFKELLDGAELIIQQVSCETSGLVRLSGFIVPSEEQFGKMVPLSPPRIKGSSVRFVTCRRCGRSGQDIDEFTSPYTGLCAKCSDDETIHQPEPPTPKYRPRKQDPEPSVQTEPNPVAVPTPSRRYNWDE